jgi:hypothetical protein
LCRELAHALSGPNIINRLSRDHEARGRKAASSAGYDAGGNARELYVLYRVFDDCLPDSFGCFSDFAP